MMDIIQIRERIRLGGILYSKYFLNDEKNEKYNYCNSDDVIFGSDIL